MVRLQHALVSFFLSGLVLAALAAAQTAPARDEGVPVLHVGTSLTLVDVIVEQQSRKLHTRQLLTDLTKEDFRMLDNGHEVSLRSFDDGSEHTARPVALWLIVQCNMGFPVSWSSTFMRDKTELLKPALAALGRTDVIGVAHWCDDGAASTDLTPSADAQAALSTVERILQGPALTGQNRQGELALQRMMGEVLTATQEMTPSRLPVFVFLYGDHSATYVDEAQEIIKSLLESSGIVFGLNEQGNELDLSRNLGAEGQVSHLIHHYAADTGGQYYSTAEPKLMASALAYIVTQVHVRYVLGFEPERIDGVRHTLRVELTKEARRRYGDPELRFRTEYIPVAVRGGVR